MLTETLVSFMIDAAAEVYYYLSHDDSTAIVFICSPVHLETVLLLFFL